eukprot:2077600-Rhodomonas_salina.2
MVCGGVCGGGVVCCGALPWVVCCVVLWGGVGGGGPASGVVCRGAQPWVVCCVVVCCGVVWCGVLWCGWCSRKPECRGQAGSRTTLPPSLAHSNLNNTGSQLELEHSAESCTLRHSSTQPGGPFKSLLSSGVVILILSLLTLIHDLTHQPTHDERDTHSTLEGRLATDEHQPRTSIIL